jgi:hypothetical protein
MHYKCYPQFRIFLYIVPLLLRPIIRGLSRDGFLAIFCDVVIFVENVAFEGELFIVQLLHMLPIVQ